MKKIIVYCVIVFQGLIIVSLVRNLMESIGSRERVDVLNEKILSLQGENVELLKERDHVQSDYYIEEIAREQLHLTKPGEILIVIDKEELGNVMGARDEVIEEMSIWRKWMEVLFGK